MNYSAHSNRKGRKINVQRQEMWSGPPAQTLVCFDVIPAFFAHGIPQGKPLCPNGFRNA